MARSRSRFRPFAGSLALALLALPSLAAKTWVVSTSAGADFADIQPAIDAAQPGDRILVYSTSITTTNVVDKGVTIMGVGSPGGSGFLVTGLPPGQVAALVDMRVNYLLHILGCQGTVVLQGLQLDTDLDITDSDDVRAFDVDDYDSFDNTTRVAGSRFELVDSVLIGVHGIRDCANPNACWPTQSSAALHASAQSRLHLVRSAFFGGDASEVNCPFTTAGSGSPAIDVTGASEVILTGNGLSAHVARGGWGGLNCYYWSTCEYGGPSAPAVSLSGELWRSGMTFEGGWAYNPPNCAATKSPKIAGSTVHPLTEVDPTLTLLGTPAAGATVTFEVAAPTGADVLLYLGRKPVVIEDPAVRVELLTPMNVQWPLGVITGGTVQKSYKIRPLPTGYTFYAQAELTYPSGEVRRTNSVPIVLR